ncbi:MAG: hypothetical protein FJ264_08640 [Planctomycetes bacterium]|nr:hypothetical protein [Planctomycetota bacterium]
MFRKFNYSRVGIAHRLTSLVETHSNASLRLVGNAHPYSVKSRQRPNLFPLFTIFFLITFSFHSDGICQNFVINGELQNSGAEETLKNSIVRKESLIIKDKRVYIQVIIDQGAKHLTDHNRYKKMMYVLPKEITYDDMSKRIYYYTEDTEIEIGQMKDFLGFMPYIGLSEGVKIVSSPADAKLLISSDNNKDISLPVIHSDENMNDTLSKKCGQCHLLEYIFSHKDWTEEDVLHAFNRLQTEREERFTNDELEIITLFKKYQKGEIDKKKLTEFQSLKHMAEKDIKDVTEGVYSNNCIPCHNPSKMNDITLLYSTQRCKSIVERMKEKEPSLFLGTDMDRLASYLWEIKLKPCEN